MGNRLIFLYCRAEVITYGVTEKGMRSVCWLTVQGCRDVPLANPGSFILRPDVQPVLQVKPQILSFREIASMGRSVATVPQTDTGGLGE